MDLSAELASSPEWKKEALYPLIMKSKFLWAGHVIKSELQGSPACVLKYTTVSGTLQSQIPWF